MCEKQYVVCRKDNNVEINDQLSRLISLLEKDTNTENSNENVRSTFCQSNWNYEWMNEKKIYIACLKAYKCMLNLPRLAEN